MLKAGIFKMVSKNEEITSKIPEGILNISGRVENDPAKIHPIKFWVPAEQQLQRESQRQLEAQVRLHPQTILAKEMFRLSCHPWPARHRRPLWVWSFSGPWHHWAFLIPGLLLKDSWPLLRPGYINKEVAFVGLSSGHFWIYYIR